MTDGLGLRYSLIGPFETMQLNANGMLYMGELGGGVYLTKLYMERPTSCVPCLTEIKTLNHSFIH